MNNLEERKERYLRDPISIRLGGLAANLARVASFVKNPANLEAVKGLVEESKYFIEWTAGEAVSENAAELVELQIKLALYQRSLDKDWNNEEKRLLFGQQAKIWSNEVLQHSGLI